MDNQEANNRVRFILRLLQDISKDIMSLYQNSALNSSIKTDEAVPSWLTQVDTKVENFLRDEIAKKYPEDAISGEEFGLANKAKKDQLEWIIDPIDGTESLVYGMPLFGSMVALLKEGEPLLGIINFPALNEQIYAIKGAGTYWSPANTQEFKQTHVSEKDCADGLLCHTGKNLFILHKRKKEFDAMESCFRLSRSWGDCYGHVMVATGRAEAAADPTLKAWDIAPVKIITEEAGADFYSFEHKSDVYAGSGMSFNKKVYKSLKDKIFNL